jgi:hypothetical protein
MFDRGIWQPVGPYSGWGIAAVPAGEGADLGVRRVAETPIGTLNLIDVGKPPTAEIHTEALPVARGR